jgi:hypothetical protein
VNSTPLKALPNRLDPAREERVEEIAQLVREGHWRKGKSSKEKAGEWGTSLSNVRGMAAEAWRRVRWEGEHSDQTAAEDVGACEKILFDSLAEADRPVLIEKGEKVYAESPSIPRKVALEAVRTRIALRAAAGPAAQVNSLEWQRMRPAEQLALVDRAQAQLDKVRADVEAKIAALAAATGDGT